MRHRTHDTRGAPHSSQVPARDDDNPTFLTGAVITDVFLS